MVSIEQRLQMKREPLDKWSTREQLCLASAVARSGDQNWMSVSRALKPFGDPNRPADWFHQKNCASHYGALLGNVETPKRKKRTSGGPEMAIETPNEIILKKLKIERLTELNKLLAEERAEYLKLQEEMTVLNSGKVTEEQLDRWVQEIEEEEFTKEQESVAHTQWLKEREVKKQEIERAWRPLKPVTPTIIGQKRKMSETLETLLESESGEDSQQSSQEQQKPALSPLLTSLLKSPSQIHNPGSILQAAIVNQNQNRAPQQTSPMIASLLNPQQQGGHQLVAISSQTGGELPNLIYRMDTSQQALAHPDMLDDALGHIKIEDIEKSIIVQDGPLPEMKNEVDVIISDLIENAHDIVADPEKHLGCFDGNGDININLLDLESDELEADEPKKEIEEQEKILEPQEIIQKQPSPAIKTVIQPPPPTIVPTTTIDPFEFQEDPEIFEPPKLPSSKHESLLKSQQNTPSVVEIKEKEQPSTPTSVIEEEIKSEPEEPKEEILKENETAENVEIVEVAEDESEENLTVEKTQEIKEQEDILIKDEPIEVEAPVQSQEELEIKEEIPEKTNISLEIIEATKENVATLTSDLTELYDDVSMEVKVDKSGKAKRDYSRTKKKEDNFDMLLAIEKAQLDDNNESDTFSEKELVDLEKKHILNTKVKDERSNSPWPDEDDVRKTRRFSTPATPIDSVPSSPASSTAFSEDDKDYRAWKKSIMLVYSRLSAHKYASLFLKPITEDHVPGYHGLIHRPMDLQTIRKNVENGVLRTTQEFARDVMLMLNNAIMFNKTNGTVYNMTMEIQQEAVESIQLLMLAQSQSYIPFRRETRTSEPGVKRKRNEDSRSSVGGSAKRRKED